MVDGWKCTTCSDAFEKFAKPAGLGVILSGLLVLFSAWQGAEGEREGWDGIATNLAGATGTCLPIDHKGQEWI
jgi:hypothetical protein